MKKHILLIIPLFLFLACSNRVIKKEQTNTEVTPENQTIKESSLLGKVLVGALTFLGTNGNLQKTFQATNFGGNASGYLVGKKLSDMQKKYKDKEETLIVEIIKIDQESTKLQKKNVQLNNSLVELKQNIKLLKENRNLKESEKNSQQLMAKNKLKTEKEKLQKLLKQNNKLSEKISFSKDKTNEYDYSKEDKKELLESVSFLEKNTRNFEKKINKKLDTINNLMETL